MREVVAMDVKAGASPEPPPDHGVKEARRARSSEGRAEEEMGASNEGAGGEEVKGKELEERDSGDGGTESEDEGDGDDSESGVKPPPPPPGATILAGEWFKMCMFSIDAAHKCTLNLFSLGSLFMLFISSTCLQVGHRADQQL